MTLEDLYNEYTEYKCATGLTPKVVHLSRAQVLGIYEEADSRRLIVEPCLSNTNATVFGMRIVISDGDGPHFSDNTSII